MEAQTGTTCSRCGTPKREANHWFVVVTNASGGYWEPFDRFAEASDDEQLVIVCGESCALKVMSAWFAEPRRELAGVVE